MDACDEERAAGDIARTYACVPDVLGDDLVGEGRGVHVEQLLHPLDDPGGLRAERQHLEAGGGAGGPPDAPHPARGLPRRDGRLAPHPDLALHRRHHRLRHLR